MPLHVVLLDPKRHDRATFESGEPSLDRYLREQAAQHHRDGISTTHVLVEKGNPREILGFYSLAAAQLRLTDLREVDRKRLPRYPVPAIRMARLAVAQSQQGRRCACQPPTSQKSRIGSEVSGGRSPEVG